MAGKWLWLAAIVALGGSSCGKSVECGKGTVEFDGECVAEVAANNASTNNTSTNGVTCGPGTEADDQNRCIVTMPTVCGAGTQLDANSGECVVTDAVCGANTAFDEASGSCLPTDMVCAGGTTFDAAMGMCMPDATCRPGDSVIDGVCASPLDALIAGADLAEVENNDPNLGGTAQPFTLPNVGESFVIAGALDAPADLDNDGNVDQDADFFSFDGMAGQWVKVTFQQTGGPLMGFAVTGPDGYERQSLLGGIEVTREFVLRTDGEHQLLIGTVSPTLAGDPTYQWAATVEVVAAPTPTTVDFSAPVMGDLVDLRSNLLTQGGFTPGNTVSVITFVNGGREEVIGFDGSDVSGVLPEIGEGMLVVPASGDLTLLVDWISADRPDATFEVNVTDLGSAVDLGAIPSGGSVTATTEFFQFTLPAGHIAEFSQSNDLNQPIEMETGGGRFNLEAIGSTNQFGSRYGYALAGLAGGPLTARVVLLPLPTNLSVTITAVLPTDLGTLTPPAAIDETSAAPLARGQRVFHRVDLATAAQLTGTLDAGNADVDFRVYDDMGVQVRSATTAGGEDFDWSLVAGTYILSVEAFAGAPTGWTLTATATELVSTPETEANNDLASANSGLTTASRIAGASDDMDPDWFSFVVAAPEIVTLTVGGDQPFVDAQLGIANAAGEVIASRLPGALGNSSVSSFLEPGTYYVSLLIMAPAGAQEPYLLGLSTAPSTASLVDAGGNDDSASAQAAVPAAGYSIQGVVSGSTDADWYAFNLAAPATFYVSGAVDAVFYDGMMNVIPATGTVDLPMGASYVAFSTFTDGGPNGYRLSFATPPANVRSSAPAAAIPDNGVMSGMVVTDIITVPNGPMCTLTSVQVSVDITHTWRGDLDISLESPMGTVVKLWGMDSSPDDDLVGVFPLTLTPDESLDIFAGEVAGGDWTITVGDTLGSDTGTFNNWSLGYNCQ